MSCPNKGLPEYLKNEEIFGDSAAHAVWYLSGEKNPSPEEALKLIYPDKVDTSQGLKAWDTGLLSGESKDVYEPKIDKTILDNPNSKIGDGESFNDVKNRVLTEGTKLLNELPHDSVVVTHSSVLKFLMEWDKQNRPASWETITPEKYLSISTHPGELIEMEGRNGTITFVRHGQTIDNANAKLRSYDTLLTDTGKKEANRIADLLSEKDISKLITSPLPRALQTSDSILKKQFENKENSDSVYQNDNKIKSLPKSVEIAQLPKTLQEWNKLQKGNISIDQFLQNSQFPKEQKELIKDIYNQEQPKTLSDLITSFAAKYSYIVEVSTAKGPGRETPIQRTDGRYYIADFDEGGDGYEISKEEYDNYSSRPTNYYANLTVPGGTNYTENEIATPSITPSIKGHAQFSTDNGIGWFRSDDLKPKVSWNDWYKENKDNYKYFNRNIEEVKNEYQNSLPELLKSKTRRILELQSDLFQKSRDKENLISKDNIKDYEYTSATNFTEAKELEDVGWVADGTSEDGEALYKRPKVDIEGRREIEEYHSSNQFLQLLNKDGNWIPFFIKSIVQDSTKKGYEKVLFPTGDTASKVEGHQTLEDFKKQKEDRIKKVQQGLEEAEKAKAEGHKTIWSDNGWEDSGIQPIDIAILKDKTEIIQLQEELKRVETEGFAALKPIYDFYENRVKNTLNKIYGKDNVERIKDEYGNGWYQVEINQKRDNSTIYFQKETNENKPEESINKELDSKITKGFLKKIGANVEHISDTGQNYNALVDTTKRIIQVVEGKANKTTLGHEATHLFLDLLPDNSKLLKEIVNDVSLRDEYDDVYEQYKNDPEYKDKNGDVDEVKIAKEAAVHIIDKIIADKFDDQKAIKWWDKLWNWVTNLFKGKDLDMYSKVASGVLEGDVNELSPEKIRKIQAANEKGQIYYELSAGDRKKAEEVRKKGNDLQKALVDALYLKPDKLGEKEQSIIDKEGIKAHLPVILDEATHTYTDIEGNVYDSVTKKINGEFSEEDQKKYEFNREAGNAFDNILSGVALDKPLSEIESKGIELSDKVKQDAYSTLRSIIHDYTSKGFIPLTQVVVADPMSKTAGSIDLLLLHRDGYGIIMDLKTSERKALDKGKLNSTYVSKFNTKEGSVFFGSDVKLSKNDQHGIQTGAYAKMLELQGIPVIGTHSLHFHLVTDNKQVTDFINEGLVEHHIGDNAPWIDAIVPTPLPEELSNLQLRRPDADYRDIDPNNPINKMSEEQKDQNAATEEELQSLKPVVDKAIDILEQRKIWLQSLNNSKPGAEIKDETIDIVTKVKRSLIDKRDNEHYEEALNQFMRYTSDQADKSLEYLRNPDFLHSDNYPRIIEQTSKFLDGYDQVYKLVRNSKGERAEKYAKTINKLNDLRSETIKGIEAYNLYFFRKTLPTETISDELIKNWIYGKTADITWWTNKFDAPHATSDLGISTATRVIREAVFKANEISMNRVKTIEKLEKDLLTVLGKKKYEEGLYDFMTNKDGTFLQRVGSQYADKVKAVRDSISDENGNLFEYKTGKTPEVIAYNKDLEQKLSDYRKLTQAEYTEDRENKEGDYQRYTREFVDQRNRFEYKTSSGKWEVRPDVADSKDYKFYKEKYYTILPDVLSLEGSYDRNGEFTGVISGKRENRYVVDPKYKEVRDISLSKQELRDKRYVDLISDQSPVGKAKQHFYSEWMKSMDDFYGDKLPDYVVKQLKGKLPVKPATLLEQCKRSGLSGVTGVLAKNAADSFSWGTYHGERLVDEAGNFKQSIPIGYRGDFKDQARIDKLTSDLKLVQERNVTTKQERDQRRQDMNIIQAQLKTEKQKITPDKIEKNIVKSFLDFVPQAEKYIQLDAIEDKVLGIRAMMREKEKSGGYFERDTMGRPIYEKGTKELLSKKESEARQLMEQMVDTVLYNSDMKDTSFMNMVAERAMSFTAFKAFGLNPLTSFAVGSMGSFNLLRSSFGKQHFTKEAFGRAFKEYWSDAMPKYVKGITDTNKKYHSKLEAFVAKYQVPVHMFSPEKGIAHAFFKAEDCTEYFIQALPAVSTAMTKDISGVNGTTKKLYDCWDYDDKTGELVPVKDFEHVSKQEEILKWFNYFQDVNSMEHGPFSALERSAITKTWIGKLTIMFHKVIYPNIKSRVGAPFNHPSFGEVEGSYRTMYNFIKDLKDYQGSIKEKWDSGFEDLDDNQKANIRKTLFDLTVMATIWPVLYGIRQIAAGVSEDDPNLKKFVNLIHKMTEKVADSQLMYIPGVGLKQDYQLVKSPIAALGTLADFSDALQETMKLPFPPYGDHYYTNGINAGDLKAAHKLKKILPGLSAIEGWKHLTNDEYFSGGH